MFSNNEIKKLDEAIKNGKPIKPQIIHLFTKSNVFALILEKLRSLFFLTVFMQLKIQRLEKM